MSLWLGARLAVAGGRESLVRIALTATGVAVGVTLLLIGLLVVPAMQGRIDRYAWHRTDAAAPATATDPALWLPSTDRYDGRDIVRFHVERPGGADELVKGAAARNVKVHAAGPTSIRCVTHKDVDADDITKALEVFGEITARW